MTATIVICPKCYEMGTEWNPTIVCLDEDTDEYGCDLCGYQGPYPTFIAELVFKEAS